MTSNGPPLPFGPGALAFVGIYVLSLLGIGFFAYRKRRGDSLGDFFLAGRDMGFAVLFLTLFATQYSGNTLLGFSGAAYRNGLGFLVAVHFMTAVVVGYVFFAPRLYRLSRRELFITPGDFIYFRFGSHFLRILITLIMIFALLNFTLAQMKTLGTVFETVSQGRIPLWAGVIGLALVMLVYESLGGMRSVAWTDAIQGGILIAGFFLLLYVALDQLGPLSEALAQLAAQPETAKKVARPDGAGGRTWLSFVVMVGLGIAIYPHSIQRIFAARSSRILKRSLAVMAITPLTTSLVAVIIGVLMAAHVPGLDHPTAGGGAIVPSETVLPLLCLKVMQASETGYWLVVVIFAALIAAVMSTADSALLSISSMITKDLYAPYFRPNAPEAHLTRAGKGIAWLLMVPIVWIAIGYDGTLIQLLSIKLEVLVQCAPAVYLGVHSRRLAAGPVALGLVAGLLFTLGLHWSGDLGLTESNTGRLFGFHTGLVGLGVNLCVIAFATFCARRNSSADARRV